jgi:hypothetical protein
MSNSERLYKIYITFIISSIILGIIHIVYAIQFYTNIHFFIEIGFKDDIELVVAYFFTLSLLIGQIISIIIVRAARLDIKDEINYIYSELSGHNKAINTK